MDLKFDIRRVLEFYDAEHLPSRGGWAKIRCVIHEDGSPSASFNELEGRFRCFVCDFFGDAIDLIRAKEGSTWHEAVKRAQEITGQDGSFKAPEAVTAKARRLKPIRIGEPREGRGESPARSTSQPTGRKRPRRISI